MSKELLTLEGPDKLLRMFNPTCRHSRCAIDQINCPDCQRYTDEHWKDVLDVGRLAEAYRREDAEEIERLTKGL